MAKKLPNFSSMFSLGRSKTFFFEFYVENWVYKISLQCSKSIFGLKTRNTLETVKMPLVFAPKASSHHRFEMKPLFSRDYLCHMAMKKGKYPFHQVPFCFWDIAIFLGPHIFTSNWASHFQIASRAFIQIQWKFSFIDREQ